MLLNTVGVKIDGIQTDIVIGNFSDKLLLIITQTGKCGSVLKVDPEIFQPSENQENVYNIRTLFGKDNNEDHLVARILSEHINATKPIVLVINLKSHSRRTVRALVEVLKKNMILFGQLIIGPPGSGKSTYCCEMEKVLKESGRSVAIINFDPANENLPYNPLIDISKYVTTSDVMNYSHLGPNGAVLYSMDFLHQCIDELLDEIKKHEWCYFLIDCPGQVELYTCHDSFRNIVESLQKIDMRLCCVHLIDSHHCSDAGKFISTLLMTLTTMLNLALPHVNILSKIDLMKKFIDELLFQPNFYTNVLDLTYLVETLDQDVIHSKYKKLNKVLASLIEDYSLIHFTPLDNKDKKCLITILKSIDKANGYIFKTDEERNIQKLLMSTMTAPESAWDCEYSDEL